MMRLWPAAILALPLAIGCTSAKEKARADSVQALASQQKVLMSKLEAQKDSLSQVVADADNFMAKVDSTVSKVKGLPKSKRLKNAESPRGFARAATKQNPCRGSFGANPRARIWATGK